jgi:phage gp29-like protein
MGRKPQLLDRWGNPVRRAELTQEVAAPTLTGIRSPLSGYPADGLNPVRLGQILREADIGDPIRYFELAETVEERDLHYLGVLGTRRRSVSQLQITVEDGDESDQAVKIGDELRKWVARQELQTELFHILDAIGKGHSHTEIVWDVSMGQYWPERLEWRDPRWFRFARHDLTTPMMLDDNGQEQPYPAFKFIHARMQAKSGLPLRSGIARAVMWGWMFKAYTQRDWAIFTQTYGQPLRVGKYGAGASEKDQDTLFRAVANIGGDCAAIIPESMLIEFVETGNLGSSTDHYEKRSDWLDKQVSKAVLGQTATTDAETGGLGSGKEHRQVQEDIEQADANDLGAILTRDIAIPFVKLNWGDQPVYPKIKIGRPEEEDLKAFGEALAPFIDRGLKVAAKPIYDKFGLSAPEANDEILRPAGKSDPQMQSHPTNGGEMPPESAVKYPFNTRLAPERSVAAEQAEGPSAGNTAPHVILGETLSAAMQPEMSRLMARIEAIVTSATSFEEMREALFAAFPDLMTDAFVDELAQGLAAAELGGRAALEDDSA